MKIDCIKPNMECSVVKQNKINHSSKDFSSVIKENQVGNNEKSNVGKPMHRIILVSTGYKSGTLKQVFYAKDSTPENPIVCDSDGNHRVVIKNVDPNNATELEMRMFCAYLDDIGKGSGNHFGTYTDLKDLRYFSQMSDGINVSRPNNYELNHKKYKWIDLSNEYMHILFFHDKKAYVRHNKLSKSLNEFRKIQMHKAYS